MSSTGADVSQEPGLRASQDKNTYEFDSNIRITNKEFSGGGSKKASRPLIPPYFKSFIKKENPASLADNLKIVTMKKILVDKYNVDFAKDNKLRAKTPEQKR